MIGMGTAYFSNAAESSEDDDDGDDEQGPETVGKKGAAMATGIRLVGASTTADDRRGVGQPGSAASPRARAQSTYSSSSLLQSNQAVVSKHRLRSQSTDIRTDRSGGLSGGGGGGGGGDYLQSRFVDPLVLRRQSRSVKTKENKPLVGAGKKVPVGQLVAFFDSEKTLSSQ